MKKYFPWLVLLIFPWLSYWQVGFMQNCMKYDIMDQYFQYRYFLSDSLSNGIWPLWLPWQYFGFPFFADPQSGAWYLPAWILSALTNYDIGTLHLEWIFHIAIGGMGMYYLLRKIGIGWSVALMMGLLFQANGVFVGNAQHMAYVFAMAWLPWIFGSFYSLFRSLKWIHALTAAIFLHLLTTGGYPSYLFILIYIISFWSLAELFIHWNKGRNKMAWDLLKLLVAIVVVFSALSVGYFYAIYEGSHFIPRGEAVEMDQILFGPYPPIALISQWSPLAVAGDPDFFGSDKSMINGFAGLLTLIGAPFALLFKKRRKTALILLVSGLLFLSASFGEYTPVRGIMAELPLMDRFRFPSVFRSFWIICLMGMGALGLDQLLHAKRGRHFTIISVGIVTALIPLLWIPMTHGLSNEINSADFWNSWLHLSGYREFLVASGPWDRMVPALIISTGLIAVYVSILLFKNPYQMVILLIVVGMETFFAIQLPMPSTITHHRPASEYQEELRKSPEDYPLPDETPVHDYRPADPRFLPSWGNNNVFNKTVSPIGFNPFKLSSVYAFERTECYQKTLKMPVLFLSNASRHCSECQVIKWEPGTVEINVTLEEADTLVLQQTHYPGWELRINGELQEMAVWCGNQLSTSLNAGNHQILFSYHRSDIKWLWMWQLLASLAVIMGLLVYFRKKGIFPTQEANPLQ